MNLASRLEGLCKVYGVSIIVSEDTRRLAGDRIVVRPLDRVAVKGREGSILVYELVGLASGVSDAAKQNAQRHGEALDAYFEKRWDDALALLDAEADEPASVLLRERIVRMKASPPGPDWDGVHRMETK